jgi:predicted MPP superfamily phosphohydrolase
MIGGIGIFFSYSYFVRFVDKLFLSTNHTKQIKKKQTLFQMFRGHIKRTTRISLGILCFGLLLLGYSYFIEPNRLVVNETEISIKGLDPALDGLRIVAISDIHGGSNGSSEANIRRLVETVNARNADAVVILGDYVAHGAFGDNPPMEIEPIAELLAPLRAKYGIFAVLGNHDGFYGGQRVAEALRSKNIRVLQNEIASFQHNGTTLRLLGLKDHMQVNSWYSYDADIKKLLAADGRRGDIIVLEHSPDIFQVINHYKNPGEDFRLMIAGHSHGGQVWLPVLGRPMVPSSFGQKYAVGHIREHGKDMFVTTGVGTSILPFRFMVPPEVAVLTLRSAAGKK